MNIIVMSMFAKYSLHHQPITARTMVMAVLTVMVNDGGPWWMMVDHGCGEGNNHSNNAKHCQEFRALDVFAVSGCRLGPSVTVVIAAITGIIVIGASLRVMTKIASFSAAALGTWTRVLIIMGVYKNMGPLI